MSPNNKRAISLKYPKFNYLEENPYQEEMNKLIDISLSEANTTRTIKNISECLAKSIKSKYGVKDKEELNTKVEEILEIHGLSKKYFDPLSIISLLTFGDLQTANDISVDPNANKTSINMEGICTEAILAYKKLAGYDYLYQTIKELYGKETAKKCMASMFDYSLALNDSTKILMPYCYCIDASKLVMEGRKFGQVHSSQAKRVSTYVSILGDTIRELSYNVAGAVAVGTFFLDTAHLAIYRERITLDELRTDKKLRKYIVNCFQQFIHTVNHYSRSAVESPFTNVSCFDREKLRNLINEDNYAWYFEKKAAIVEDNELPNTKEAFTDFVLDYIEELQEIYIDIFDAGDPLRNGLQFPFPVTTINLAIDVDKETGKRELVSQSDKLYGYVTKKDISKFNVYCSEGTKVASCCRLLSDSDMIAMADGVNSFGGSQVSLGSHRVVTLNFARAAYEANSYDDFKAIISERVEEMSKILKAHRVLIHKLEKCGTQPWITNGWINMSHMFSTFGCVGYVEADEILKKKFNHSDYDYMKDFLVYFNNECKVAAEKENIIWNIEAIPAEGMAPKLAKADKILVEGEYNIYANQWCSLWEDHTIYEKMKRDGEINELMTGGSIVHINVDSEITSSQAKTLISDAVKYGMAHFAINSTYVECQDCGHVHKGKVDECPKCQSKNVNHYTRVIGYFSKVEGWNKARREHDWKNRKFMSYSQIQEQLGK
ncbi:MAG: anaerobic ribonucleoside-triphosphate reductase [Succinivibrionaceae bacterium]